MMQESSFSSNDLNNKMWLHVEDDLPYGAHRLCYSPITLAAAAAAASNEGKLKVRSWRQTFETSREAREDAAPERRCILVRLVWPWCKVLWKPISAVFDCHVTWCAWAPLAGQAEVELMPLPHDEMTCFQLRGARSSTTYFGTNFLKPVLFLVSALYMLNKNGRSKGISCYCLVRALCLCLYLEIRTR